MRHVWLEIPDLPRYLVSQTGHVWDRRYDREVMRSPDRNGYLRVHLQTPSGRKTVSVHRLVAGTFYEANIDGREINHDDGIKSNNFLANLEISTRSKNMKHAYAMGLVHVPKETKVRCVETGEIFRTMRAAARVVGVSDHKSILRVLDNPNRSTRGLHFERVI